MRVVSVEQPGSNYTIEDFKNDTYWGTDKPPRSPIQLPVTKNIFPPTPYRKERKFAHAVLRNTFELLQENFPHEAVFDIDDVFDCDQYPAGTLVVARREILHEPIAKHPYTLMSPTWTNVPSQAAPSIPKSVYLNISDKPGPKNTNTYTYYKGRSIDEYYCSWVEVGVVTPSQRRRQNILVSIGTYALTADPSNKSIEADKKQFLISGIGKIVIGRTKHQLLEYPDDSLVEQRLRTTYLEVISKRE